MYCRTLKSTFKSPELEEIDNKKCNITTIVFFFHLKYILMIKYMQNLQRQRFKKRTGG